MDTRDLVLNACHRLNAEAYEYQVLKAKKRLKQFEPCPKAEMLMAVLREGKHFGQAHINASVTPCPCHSSLTERELMDYEYDDTYRRAHERGDRQTLYPKLYAR